MTSKLLETIDQRLNALHGQAFFKLHAGLLKDRLLQEVIGVVTGDLAEAVAAGNCELEVSVFSQDGDSPMVSFTVNHPGVAETFRLPASGLAHDVLEDLIGHLTRLVEQQTQETPVDGQNKPLHPDYHEQDAASARLRVSPDWLKRIVPCTDYRYEEIDGKKYVREYYWSKPLIERLFKIKCNKTTPEDLQFVAKECCEGDVDWARDLIGRLKSPNRPETPPKEQSQKGQGGQGRQGQQGKQVQGQVTANERSRRSRHRRGGRDGNKEGGAKPQSNAPPKETR
jgi:hypothetical protein